jgi:MFS family permease
VRAYVAGIAVAFATGWNIANVGAVATDLSRDYRAALATIGLFTTAQFLVHMLLQIPAGRAADRFGARRVALLALLVLAAGNALALGGPHVWLALLAKAICGIGTGLAFIAASDYIRASGGSPFVQGIYGGASVVAPGAALAIVPALEGPLAWRSPFVTALVLAAAVAALVGTAPDAPRTRAHGGEEVAGVVRDRRLYRFAIVHTGAFGLSVVVGNWVVTLFQKHGVSHGAAAAAGSLTLLLSFFTRAWGGWLLRRRPLAMPAIVATSLLAGGLATFALALPLPFGLLVVAAAAVGLAAGVPFAPTFAGAAAERRDAPGAAIGFVNGCAALAIVGGTPLLGLTFSLPGHGRIGFAVVGVLWTLSALATPRRFS